MATNEQALKDRIGRYVHHEPNSGCHLWAGAVNRKGYGRIRIGRKTHRVHRVVLELKLGRKLPRRIHACHDCDNPACVNPDHLWPGSNRKNVADRVQKGRQPRTAHSGVRLDKKRAQQVREARKAGVRMADVIAMFGVKDRQVQRICAGQAWR